MGSRELKKYSIIISTCLTTFFEALINLIDKPSFRQILNPVCVLMGIALSIWLIHRIKIYAHNLRIKNNEEELQMYETQILVIEEYSPLFDTICLKKDRCISEITRLKREKSKIYFF